MTTLLANVQGLPELQRRLKQIPINVASKVLKKGVASGAGVVRKAAKSAAPASKLPRRRGGRVSQPGTLKRSAIIKFVRENSSATQTVYIVTFRRGKKEQQKQRDAFYASWVEFGHKIVPRKGRGGRASLRRRRAGATGQVRPHKFLTPAFYNSAGGALEAMKNKIATELGKVLK